MKNHIPVLEKLFDKNYQLVDGTDEIFELDIIENIYQNIPNSIPVELESDISKLLKMYNLNKKYALNKTPEELKILHKKIIEIIN